MSRISQAFSRLSQREKILVSVMGVGLVLGVVTILNFVFQGKIDELEASIATETDSLRQIYASTDDYLEATKKFDATRKQALANAELNVATAIAEIADKITFEAVDPRTGPLGKKDLESFMDFKPPKEKSVGPKKKTTSAKKTSTAGYYQRDQEITLKENIPFETVYTLLEKIEESQDLLFVTDLRLERSRLDPERAGPGKIVVSTFYWQGDKNDAKKTP